MKRNLKRFAHIGKMFALVLTASAIVMTSCEENQINDDQDAIEDVQLKLSSKSVKLSIKSATADDSHSSYPPSKAIDGVNSHSSRWAGYGDPNNLTLDLGSVNKVDYVKIAFAGGNSRNYTFQVWTRETSSSSWTRVGKKTSAGESVDFETFDITNSDARYVRLKCTGSNVNDWNNIREVEVWGTIYDDDDDDDSSDNGGSTGTASYPSDLMDNYKQWKITYPDGEEDKTLYHETNEYFHVSSDKNAIVFYAPIRSDNGTTKNSDYIRSELRERTSDGGSDIYWTTSGTHVVYVKQAITHLPIVKDHLVATQIHGNKDDGIDDAMVLRLEGSHLFLSFNGGDLRDDITITRDYTLGTVHEVIFEVKNGKHYCYYSEDGNLESKYNSGNASSYLIKDGSNSYVMNKSYDDAYFKIGNYTQSNADKEGSYADKSSNYGEVYVYDFWVKH